MDFKAQYKHPLWQKRRLDVLEKAEFACSCCGDTDSQLHVHHRQYFKDRKIWEYGDDELEVLCEACHEEAHQSLDIIKSLLSTLSAQGLNDVAALIAGYRSSVSGPAQREDGPSATFNAVFQMRPLTFKAGELAGRAENLNIHVIDELALEVDRNANGGHIDVLVPRPKSFGHKGFD